MKDCSLCAYDRSNFACDEKDKLLHCLHCSIDDGCLLPIGESYPKISCNTCKHYYTEIFKNPCVNCREYSLHSNTESEQEKLRNEITEAIKEFAFSYNPCKFCDYRNLEDKEYCQGCCYFYPSKFKFKSK